MPSRLSVYLADADFLSGSNAVNSHFVLALFQRNLALHCGH